MFLMYRVELKDSSSMVVSDLTVSFLMYRVELKVGSVLQLIGERLKVPNVPCGVERKVHGDYLIRSLSFLMYRVELKGP